MATPILITFLTLFSILALAEESCSTTISHGQKFRLVASLTYPQNDLDPPIDGHVLSSYHLSACYDVAVLVPLTSSTGSVSGRAFYANGTVDEILSWQGNVLTDGGTPLTSYGIVVPKKKEADSVGRRAVRVQCGMGTKGVGIKPGEPNGKGVPTLQYKEKKFGVWYACNADLPYGPAVVLYYRGKGDLTPEGCVEVMLDVEW